MADKSLHELLELVNSEQSLLDFIAALVKDRRDAIAAAEKRNQVAVWPRCIARAKRKRAP